MENFSVNITVNDCCYNKCHSSNNSYTKIFTSLNDFLPLRCCYYLKIIAVTSTYVIISIDNSNIYFVRKAFVNIPIRICIPNNCSTHIITVTINSITAS